ncbi:hypothetical protein V6N12_071720 [Hibiscus sabdariffa]|uniref:Uncharacterized protein n=1 Tax=Hibiscus sabdariffa TaxID=183260 RepID=A0ABR2FLE5_9ROSI
MTISAMVESKRLKTVHDNNLEAHPGAIVPMQVWCLFPQLVVVGIGDALHFPGQAALYYQEFPVSLRSTATAMVSLVVGIAFYVSTGLIDLIRNATGVPDGSDVVGFRMISEPDRLSGYASMMGSTALVFVESFSRSLGFATCFVVVAAVRKRKQNPGSYAVTISRRSENSKLRLWPLRSSGVFLQIPMAIHSTITVIQALLTDRHFGPNVKAPAASIIVVKLLSSSIFAALFDRFLFPARQNLTGGPLSNSGGKTAPDSP